MAALRYREAVGTSRLTRRTLLAGGTLAGVAAASGCLSDDVSHRPTDGAHCFTAAEDQRRLNGLRVFQQAFPPVDDAADANYLYWPCTDAATSQDINRSTWTGGNIWAFVWANRRNDGSAWNKKPNPLPAPRERVGPLECRAVFTSHAKANAATRCQLRYLLGMPPAHYQEPWLRLREGASSADFISDSDFRERPGDYCRTNTTWKDQAYRVMVDRVLLPAARLTEGPNAENRVGVVLDYEVQDGRRPEITEAFVRDLAGDFAGTGKSLFFLTNPFDAPSQQHTGCTPENLPAIFDAVDYMSVFLWSGNSQHSIPASYAAQLRMLGPLSIGDHDKLVVHFELGHPGTTMDDARWLHRLLHDEQASGPDKVMFWRNDVSQGGACGRAINEKISAVCFGE